MRARHWGKDEEQLGVAAAGDVSAQCGSILALTVCVPPSGAVPVPRSWLTSTSSSVASFMSFSSS